MNKYIPLHYEREDFCPNCNNKRAMIIYDRYGNPFNYSNILDQNQLNIFDPSRSDHVFSHMKCRFCKKEYLIDWTDERPKPMFYEFYKKFMRNFKMTKIV